MAGVYDELQALADELATKVGQARREVLQGMLKLVEGKSAQESIQLLIQLDVEQSMKLKLAQSWGIFEAGVVKILEQTFTTAVLEEATLRSLMLSVEGKLSTRFTSVVGSDMRTIIVDGIANGKFPSQILKESAEELDKLGHSLSNMSKEIQTGFSQYTNSITNMIAQEMPKSTKFVYIGAYDDRTRERCVEKIKFGAKGATAAQIRKQFGNLDNELWNCRHGWEQMSDSVEDQGLELEKSE